MKNFVIILLVVIASLATRSASAQEWAPLGAQMFPKVQYQPMKYPQQAVYNVGPCTVTITLSSPIFLGIVVRAEENGVKDIATYTEQLERRGTSGGYFVEKQSNRISIPLHENSPDIISKCPLSTQILPQELKEMGARPQLLVAQK